MADVQYLLKNDKNAISLLKQHGDFRSAECIDLLKQADIVVTNPPFSLLREYIGQLIKYERKFLIVGNVNAATNKDIFSLFMNNRIWLGYGFNAGNAYFKIPIETKPNYAAGVYNEETGLVKFRNCHWYTNLDHSKRHEELDLVCHYSIDEYPSYDNYNAIEVSKTSDIPCDYLGAMGVPITFLDKYNPEQFEILGATENETTENVKGLRIPGYAKYDRPYIKGIRKYSRILIRNKHPKTL